MADIVQQPNTQPAYIWFSSVYDWIKRRVGIASVSSTYTVPENIFYVRADVTSSGFTVTLPLAKGRDGRQILVKKIDASGNTLTVGISGSDTIEGGASVTTTTQWKSWLFVSNGDTIWERIT